MEAFVGEGLTDPDRPASLANLSTGREIAARSGTHQRNEMEFVLLTATHTLFDELLTPPFVPFWPKDGLCRGAPPEELDKTVLLGLSARHHWSRNRRRHRLPEEIIRKTGEKYREALALIGRRPVDRTGKNDYA
jgi:phosphoribosylaminoimidazole-succinocarboxamide synthase